MILNKRFHLILVRVLFVVVGVQAIAPDSENFASLRALNTLYELRDPSTDDAESPENLPDDDSGPARLGQVLREDGRVLDTLNSRFLPAGPIARTTRRDARPIELVRRHVSPMECMLRMHCRLTC